MEENQQHRWREKILEQGLTQLGLAVMILSGRGEVIYATKAAEDLLEKQNGLKIVDNHLVADLVPDNTRLQKALLTATDSQQSGSTSLPSSISLYVHRELQPKPYHVSVSRMLNQEDERRENHNILILIKDLSLNYDHWTERLRDEFHLSPREIECVILLTERRDVHELAEVMELSVETIRQYIKNTFKKMDVQKQHELVSLALEYRRNR